MCNYCIHKSVCKFKNDVISFEDQVNTRIDNLLETAYSSIKKIIYKKNGFTCAMFVDELSLPENKEE